MKTFVFVFLMMSGACFAEDKKLEHLTEVRSQLKQMQSKMKQLESMTHALEQMESGEHAKNPKAKKKAQNEIAKICGINSAASIKECLMNTLRDITSIANTVGDEVDH